MFCSYCGFKNIENFNFCSSCGKSSPSLPSNNENQNSLKSNKIELNKLVLISENIHVGIGGDDAITLHEHIGKSFGVANAFKVYFNLYASKDFFIALPISKDRSNLKLFGLLLGAGALASAAMTYLDSVSRNLSTKSADSILETENPFYGALIFNTREITVEVKEQKKRDWDHITDLFKKDTWFKISGNAFYKNQIFSVHTIFVYEGQVSDASKKRLPVFDLLFSSLQIPAVPVHTGTNPPF